MTTSSGGSERFQGVGAARRAMDLVEGAQVGVANPVEPEALVDADLDTLATALYVRTDDLLKDSPERLRGGRGSVSRRDRDAELVTLAVMQALLGYTSEAPLAPLRPRPPAAPVPVPAQAARLQQAAARAWPRTMRWLIRMLARDTSLWTDDVWVVDSTPVECGRSRETVKRSDLAGWAEYGYCASHSRYFWGLRLHLVCTLHGLPIGFALTGAKADEREALLGCSTPTPTLSGRRRADRDRGQELLRPRVRGQLAGAGLELLRPARKGEHRRAGSEFFKPLRQVIESINDTFKGQLDLEHHGGRTPAGVASASCNASSP